MILLLIGLWLPAVRLSLTKWTPDLSRIEFLVILGVAAGLAIGYLRIQDWHAKLALVLVSLLVVPWQMSRLPGQEIPFMEMIRHWLGELSDSLRLVLSNQPVTTPLLFLTVMGILFWSIGVLGGYNFIRRGKPWLAVILAGVSIFLVDFYHPFLKHPARYTGVFVLVVLFLIARLFYLHSRRRWEDQSMRVDYDTGYGIGRSALIAGSLLLLLTWNLTGLIDFFRPSSASGVSGIWKNLEDRFENIVLGLQNSGVSTGDFGNSLSLGSGAALGESVVFKVYLNPLEVDNIRIYWRGHTYDRYENGQWRSTLTDAMTMYTSQWSLPYPDWRGRKEISIQVSPQTRAQRTIFAPAPPLSVDRMVEVIGQHMPDGTFDFVALVVDPTIGIGDEVQMRVWLGAPTVSQLRSTVRDYPSYIEDLYLDVPEQLATDFQALAQQITAGLDAPYDKVMAITSYLRNNIEYKVTVDPHPIDRDPLEWFLFESREGFCNYYASAAVLLIRSVGIPARMAVGYAEGVYRGEAYEVRTKDSHAWPEVYFPDYGWVEFEPTASQPETVFPQERDDEGGIFSREGLEGEADREGADPFAGRIFGEPPEDAGAIAGDAVPAFPWLTVIVLSLLLAIALTLTMIVNRSPDLRGRSIPEITEKLLTARNIRIPGWLTAWSRFSQLSPIARRYALVNGYLYLSGDRPEPGWTPQERIARITDRVPQVRYQAAVLLEQFQRESFSDHLADDKSTRVAFRQMLFPLLNAWWRKLLRI
ncbi:MAG: transglutaminase domain-containing protein [Anaerolineae bacterium]|nr:transglutaminase domain-containing protein [Anaerolineae bacterium]